MENKLMIFENDAFGKVRTLNLNGEQWFVAADVCKALELGNPSMTVERLDDDEKGISTIDTLGGKQRMAIINEPGLYSLVITSRKPEAKAFKRWITHEVIPAIRKHGAYMTKSVLEQVLENPELVLLMAQRMLEEQRKNELLQRELRLAKPKADFYDEKLKLFAEHPELLDALMKSLYAAHAENLRHRAERQTLLPKADYYDAFMDADGCTNLRTTAKELNVPERWFARFLQQTGFLYRSPAGNLMPYAIPRNRGLFRVRDYVRNGHSGAYTLITPMGKSLFRELLRCGEALPTD